MSRELQKCEAFDIADDEDEWAADWSRPRPLVSEAISPSAPDSSQAAPAGHPPMVQSTDWTMRRPFLQANAPPAREGWRWTFRLPETSGERRTLDKWRDTPAWTSIKGGSNTWREWIDIIGLNDDQTPIGVDKHGVTDRMRGKTPARTGSDLARMDPICPISI